ncbi:valacyclovir hydrolase-like [Diadema setosum]|uniref:valacyclovir hydrolase-like n=1 Tax=Diadema setosum TaxID=31175 RepID=UPI003B3BE396
MAENQHLESRSPGFESGKVWVNGVELYYERVGRGEHVLLLMPGAVASIRSSFQPQLDTLDREIFTLVAFDPRGYGWSRPPRRDFPEDFLLRDARDGRELMRALGYSRFSILGWCAGGISALLLAATYPDDVNKLVVWGSFAYMTDTLVDTFESTGHFVF